MQVCTPSLMVGNSRAWTCGDFYILLLRELKKDNLDENTSQALEKYKAVFSLIQSLITQHRVEELCINETRDSGVSLRLDSGSQRQEGKAAAFSLAWPVPWTKAKAEKATRRRGDCRFVSHSFSREPGPAGTFASSAKGRLWICPVIAQRPVTSTARYC